VAEEKMNVKKVIELLNVALPLQMRSATLYTWIAGTATGFEFQAVGAKLEEFGTFELDDARKLIEKVVALGGNPTPDVKGFQRFSLSKTGLGKIIKLETEALDALREVIPETGQEARSEALEHLLEHIILRKQDQVDYLERVRLGAS
jgi:bacterioferritin (cytochrome b1)